MKNKINFYHGSGGGFGQGKGLGRGGGRGRNNGGGFGVGGYCICASLYPNEMPELRSCNGPRRVACRKIVKIKN